MSNTKNPRPNASFPISRHAKFEWAWLSRDLALPGLWDLMDHSDARALRAYEVSRAVNNARNDSPELILPVGDRAAEEVLV